jgi:hypothetical protein
MSIIHLVAAFLGSLFKSQRQLDLENLALRQQVTLLRQSGEATTCHAHRKVVLDILFSVCRWLAYHTTCPTSGYRCTVASSELHHRYTCAGA